MSLRPGDRVAGKYRIERLLGEGGTGAVYVAENERLGKRVALKVFRDGFAAEGSVDRFVREATAASSLKHPGIVEIHDADVHEGTPWIAMELLEGETLGARIGRAAIPVDEALDVVLEALAAIGAAHAAGLVHRDLKPENVFLEQLPDGRRRVKVLDFGIAKEPRPTTGAPPFLAPEQAMSGAIDARADVYAMGAILFYALGWQLPYHAASLAELVQQMQTRGPRKLGSVAPHVPPDIAAIVDRCLSVDPALRPASAAALATELERARGQKSATPKTMAMSMEELAAPPSAPPAWGGAWQPQSYGSPPLGPTHAPPPSSSGSGGVIAIVVITLAALIGIPLIAGVVGAVFWMRSRSAPPERVEVVSVVAPSGASLSSLGLPGADAARSRVEVPPRAPRRGPDDALVTIVMFSDYQCPFCNRVEPTLTRLREAYGSDLRIVWRDNPLAFHPNAMPAAELAREAYAQGGDQRYWQVHDLLFANQQALDRASLERYAVQVGLDLARVRAALDQHTQQAPIQADMEAATRVGARGTPSFFINGRSLSGAQPYESFDTIVSEEMALARALVAGGTPRAALYSRFLEGATDGPPPSAAPAPSARPQPDPSAVYRVPVGDSPQQGPADALVTVVAISEFQCPYCARVTPTLEQLRERYGDDLRIVFKHNPLPFHTNAMPAAEAAIEVYTQRGAPAFWRYHDTLFENGQQLTRENLERWAQQLGGVDMARFRAALDDHRHQARIAQDQELARSLGATGTPSFFINGRNLRGAQPFEAFRALIDEELTRARAQVAQGTPRAQVYDALTANGHTTPQLLPAAPAAPVAPAPADDPVYTIPTPDGAPSRGPRAARVTIQIFSDFQCPFCARVRPTIDRLLAAHPNDVRLVWRNYPLPFHQQADLAAEAAMEVHAQGGSEKFWRYHDVLFENQRALSREDLERYAVQIGGIDMARFRRALDARTHRASVQADMAAVTASGARIGTPSFFINGRLLQGAQPYEAFEAAVQRASSAR